MKATLVYEFNLPEEETEFKHAQMGSQYHSALYAFYYNTLRKYTKHSDNLTPSELNIVEKIKDEFMDEITSRDIEI